MLWKFKKHHITPFVLNVHWSTYSVPVTLNVSDKVRLPLVARCLESYNNVGLLAGLWAMWLPSHHTGQLPQHPPPRPAPWASWTFSGVTWPQSPGPRPSLNPTPEAIPRTPTFEFAIPLPPASLQSIWTDSYPPKQKPYGVGEQGKDSWSYKLYPPLRVVKLSKYKYRMCS